MIAFLQGKLVHKEPTNVILDVNGVGYHLHISLQTYSEIKEAVDVVLHTHLAIREDAHLLFGFSSTEEKKLFQQLISVNGVGPGTAIVMLSYMTSNEMRAAIIREDATTLQSIKGIGGKTALRVIIELKDKLKKESWISCAASCVARPYPYVMYVV
jgi:Holliday junction DNA helicase RuvA